MINYLIFNVRSQKSYCFLGLRSQNSYLFLGLAVTPLQRYSGKWRGVLWGFEGNVLFLYYIFIFIYIIIYINIKVGVEGRGYVRKWGVAV